MLALIIAILIGLAVTLACDYMGRKKLINDELSRKLPHITVALLYGALPFVVDIKFVTIGAALQLIGAPIALKLKLFHHARKIDRKSWGEFTFPAGVLLASLITDDKWVFAAAMLNLGIADALAAFVGRKYGRKNGYKILTQTKSVAGSLAFYICSLFITVLALQKLGMDGQMFWQTLLWLPITLTAAENAGVYGLDNLTIPVLAAAILNPLVV